MMMATPSKPKRWKASPALKARATAAPPGPPSPSPDKEDNPDDKSFLASTKASGVDDKEAADNKGAILARMSQKRAEQDQQDEDPNVARQQRWYPNSVT